MATIYSIDKDRFEIYNSVRKRIIVTRPELLHKLTSKRFSEALIFLKGFMSCLLIMAEEPIRTEEIKEFALSELVNYILDENDKSKTNQEHKGNTKVPK